MKRNLSAAIVLLSLLCWAALQFTVRSRAQEGAAAAGGAPEAAPTATAEVAAEPPSLNCAGCHGAGRTLPYLGGERFHKEAHRIYEASSHARAAQESGNPTATCLDCHAVDGRPETILPARDAKSTVNRANLSTTCGKCHTQPAQTFHDSIHGKGQARGINASASCADCHGAHDILPASDARAHLSRAQTPATCAKCHTTILADYETSSHGAALRRGDERAPVCTTCHAAVSHAKAPETLRDFDLQIALQCGKCHEKQAPSYRDTFHGQATALGFQRAATCTDCHTPHRNLPPTDPRSSVSPANLISTCGKCHERTNANFVAYDPHPEPTDRHRSFLVWAVHGFMKLLFIFVFGFFGLHTLLWLQRSVVGMLRGETRRIREGAQWVVRFNRSNRLTHVVIVVSFLVLAATGLPLMFYYTNWGQTLARLMGGLTLTRFLHRVFAVVTFGYAFYHLGYLLWLLLLKRDRSILFGPNSMVPRPKDFQDLRHMVLWFLYREKRPPQFDRWTYWEKFDYFAVFWGVPVIGLSGLMLWLPGLFSRALPGSLLNAAMIIHSEEALLATGFIFAFHFFHNHMRPENFPLDTVIFTGKLPLERFEEERPEEYQRLVEEGRLDEILTTPPTPRERLISTVFGFAAYIIGLILVVGIFWTLLFSRS